ncbi:MAG: RNA-binding protein [Acidimicrobiia bacterium]|nr:RNA-binding protein [Acidimicrobiia bacterium]MBT8250333.1 RNA-binding protein [Acidimicrobiia bacterium]
MQKNRSTKIFVGNLPWSHDDELLARLFEQHGEVLDACVVVDNITGKSRGFGFVEMPKTDQAEEAIRLLHECEIEGRKLEVSFARPRERSVG